MNRDTETEMESHIRGCRPRGTCLQYVYSSLALTHELISCPYPRTALPANTPPAMRRFLVLDPHYSGMDSLDALKVHLQYDVLRWYDVLLLVCCCSIIVVLTLRTTY